MKRTLLTAATLLALGATPAWAAGNFYVLGAVGTTDADISKGELDNEITGDGLTLLSSSLDNTDTGYKLQLGYQFNPNFAIEGGYLNLGKFNYSVDVAGGSGQGDAKVDGWNIAVLGMMPLTHNFGLFAKLGTIDAKVKSRVSATGVGGTASVDESKAKWKTHVGLGGTYQFSPNVGVRLEYEEFWKLGDAATTGEADVTLWSIGVSYRF